MRQIALILMVFAALCLLPWTARPASALPSTVDISYCQYELNNNTYYRVTQDIRFNEENASTYHHLCFYDGRGIPINNITIDLNGYTYYPSNNTYSHGAFLRQNSFQLGYTVKNGTIDFSNVTIANRDAISIFGYPFTISNLTLNGAGIGRYGVLAQFDAGGGARDTIIENFSYDSYLLVDQSAITSCNVTYLTAGGTAAFSAAACTGSETTTTTTSSTLPEVITQAAAATEGLAGYAGAMIGGDVSLGKFVLWTAGSIMLTIGAAFELGKANTNNWVLDGIIFLAMLAVGIAAAWVPAWIGVALILIGVYGIISMVRGAGGD